MRGSLSAARFVAHELVVGGGRTQRRCARQRWIVRVLGGSALA